MFRAAGSASERSRSAREDGGVAKAGDGQRLRLLRRLRGRQFHRIRFRALDAVVIRVPDDAAAPPPAVREAFEQRQLMRFYPVEGGAHLVKWPHAGGVIPEDCTVEPGGWDHEHCSGCNRHINVGGTFWQTARGSCFWLCPYCYRRLRQL
jgi:hypothetical protein